MQASREPSLLSAELVSTSAPLLATCWAYSAPDSCAVSFQIGMREVLPHAARLLTSARLFYGTRIPVFKRQALTETVDVDAEASAEEARPLTPGKVRSEAKAEQEGGKRRPRKSAPKVTAAKAPTVKSLAMEMTDLRGEIAKMTQTLQSLMPQLVAHPQQGPAEQPPSRSAQTLAQRPKPPSTVFTKAPALQSPPPKPEPAVGQVSPQQRAEAVAAGISQEDLQRMQQVLQTPSRMGDLPRTKISRERERPQRK